MNQIATPAVIGYYEAVEILLQHARGIGEYRTHFGLLDSPDADHCFIRNVALPHLQANYSQRKHMQLAMDRLQSRLFEQLPADGPKQIADIGFGSGGTLHYLAQMYPNHDFCGININPVQYGIAREYLAEHENVQLHNLDFFQFRPQESLDLLYFIESAFHMGSLESLGQKIAECLKPGGEVWFIDIFQKVELERRLAGKGKTGLFSYASVERWRAVFAEYGMFCTDYENLSPSVANYCRISTPLEVFLNEIVPEIVPEPFAPDTATQDNFKRVYHGYKRLSRQLQKGILEYGILRFQKTNA